MALWIAIAPIEWLLVQWYIKSGSKKWPDSGSKPKFEGAQFCEH
jgi:hypothetical protein